ncbi:MAG TPA: glycosyltransferase family 2 protein [Xanthobacteraceae bacterium]|nr:glycosyltransferase family 2 protein [Xanthobacteraceae bacterium]
MTGSASGRSLADSIAVIIPALNEEASIDGVVRAIRAHAISRIIVADGGSRDETAARARAAGAVVIDAGRGYGRACLRGAEAADTADVLVFMDGDGADDPSQLSLLVEPILSGQYDFVIGSRVRGDRAPGSMAWHQILAGLLFGLAIRAFYGVRYTDMCAFRAIHRDVLLDLGMSEMTYGWNIEMQMLTAREGLRILEIPVAYHCRTGGLSKVAGSLRGTIRAATAIASTFVRVAMRKRASVTAGLRST